MKRVIDIFEQTRLVLLLLAAGDSGFEVFWREASSPQLALSASFEVLDNDQIS